MILDDFQQRVIAKMEKDVGIPEALLATNAHGLTAMEMKYMDKRTGKPCRCGGGMK